MSKTQQKDIQTVKDKQKVSRRMFLRRGLFVGAGVASAATLSSQTMASVTSVEEIPETAAKQDGYRVTKHIADYYKSAEV